MLTQFSNVEVEKVHQDPNYYELYRAKQPEDLFWLCNCLHYGITHTNMIGNCRLIYCECAKFEQKGFYFKLEITKLDVFQHENSDLVFDSPDFWLIYESWDKNYDRTKD